MHMYTCTNTATDKVGHKRNIAKWFIYTFRNPTTDVVEDLCYYGFTWNSAPTNLDSK